jgi:hypothetical protein
VKACPNTSFTQISNWKDITRIDSDYWKQYLDDIIFPEFDTEMRKAIGAMNMLNRSSEELVSVKNDIVRTEQHLLCELKCIDAALERFGNNMEVDHVSGEQISKAAHVAWLHKEKKKVELQLTSVQTIFETNEMSESGAENNENEEYLYEREVDINIDGLALDNISLNSNDNTDYDSYISDNYSETESDIED